MVKRILLLAALCAILYPGLSAPVEEMRDYRYENVQINGVELEGLTMEEAASRIAPEYPDIRFVLPDGTEEVLCNFNKIGTISYKNALEAAREGGAGESGPDIYYNEASLLCAVHDFVNRYNADKKPPENARIVYDDHHFMIVDSKNSFKLDEPLVLDAVRTTLDGELPQDYVIDLTDCVLKPDIDSTQLELTPEMEAVNNVSAITVDMDGGEIIELDEDTVRSWLIYQNENGRQYCDLNTRIIHELVEQWSNKYNTYKTKRTFLTSTGDTIQVGGSDKDTFGYMLDIEETYEKLKNAVYGDVKDIKASWQIKGKVRRKNSDIGNTYVEVSIPAQHLWYYKDGEVALETDVVTGGPASGGTTTGVFMVLYRESPSVLKGEGYETHVQYWMPVTYTGTGLHDASWRGTFGGNIYTYNGSHGCVNMPTAKAKELYDMIENNTPVIIYGQEELNGEPSTN